MNVCAAIVTYQPDIEELRVNLARIRPQVASVVLIDNASRDALRNGLRGLSDEFSCTLIENAENLGIAAALNQAVTFAAAQPADFILFLDQDSGVSPDFVAQEWRCYEESSQENRIGVVTPTVVKRFSGARLSPVELSNGTPVLAQTSGALMPLAIFADAGLFREDLFIDYVDYEYCLRMAKRGWKIVYAEAAKLDHMPGNETPVHVLGRTIYTANASPLRHYYETRNSIWVALHFFRAAPEIATRIVLHMLYIRMTTLIFESDRRAKLSAMGKGAIDALRGRLGPRPPARS